MQLHVRSGVRLCECSAEGSFGEDRKLQRVIFLSSPNPNRSLHQSTPLSASLPERPINHLLLGQSNTGDRKSATKNDDLHCE
jgi:hypothetical protein